MLRFLFPAAPPRVRNWWLVITPSEADVCDVDPGHDVDVQVTADLRCLIDVWRGGRTRASGLRSGELAFHGPEELRRALPAWFKQFAFATVPRA